MGFQRVRRHAGIVAPHFRQQLLAGDRLAAGAIEVLQDVGFLFGQARLLLPLVDQHLQRRLELVGPDAEGGVLRRLVRAHLGADARQQHCKAERLGDIVVGAGVEAEDLVGIRDLAGQHDDGRGQAALAQQTAGFAAVHVRQVDVEQDQVGIDALAQAQAFGAVGRLNDLEFFVQLQLFGQGFAQFVVVIDYKEGFLLYHDPVSSGLLVMVGRR